MVWSTALDHNTQNCNLVVQAESMVMAKERIVEQYGPIRYTIGSGCSGGSIYQQQAANDYPGIFDGILPACSFPDSWSTAIEVVDCRLLVDYFDDPSKWAPGVAWPSNQQAAVEGHPGPNICQSWINVYGFDEGGNPRQTNGPTGLNLQSCNVEQGVGPDKAYDPQTNPGGVRCDLGSYFVDELGERAPQFWGPIEQALGHGFVAPPFDNVGVQYGLGALQAGTITPAQFIDLNQKVGGRTIDYDPSPDRGDRSGHEPAPARDESGEGQARRSARPLHRRRRQRAAECELPDPVSLLRRAAHGGRRAVHGRRAEVPAEAHRPQRLRHRAAADDGRSVRAARGDLPIRRVRLQQAGLRPAAYDSVDGLRRRPRRQAALITL